MTNGKAQISFATSLLLAIVLWDSLTIIDIQLKPRETFLIGKRVIPHSLTRFLSFIFPIKGF